MKTITVPKTKDSEKRLDYDQATSDELLEYVFENEEDFYSLWNQGVFNDINDACNKMIADFETESICDQNDLQRAKEVLEKHIDEFIIPNILKLVEEAIKRETGLYFFF